MTVQPLLPIPQNDMTQQALLASLPPAASDTASGSTPQPWAFTESHPRQEPEDDQVVVQVHYIALNPFDWMGVKYKFALGKEAKVLGRDASGIIIARGRKVTNLEVGDKVWVCSNTALPHSGTFQEYSVHCADQVFRIPPHMSLKAASAIGTGFLTAAITMFKCFGFAVGEGSPKAGDGEWIFFPAGTSSTGIYLTQIAHHLGLKVITTAAPTHHNYLKSLGADVVLPRVDDLAELVDEVRSRTGDNVTFAVDNVGPDTATHCVAILEGSRAWRASSQSTVSDSAANSPASTDTLSSVETTSSRGQFVALAGGPKAPKAISPASDSDTTSPSSSAESDATRTVDSIRISFSTTFFGDADFAANLVDYAFRHFTSGQFVPQCSEVDVSGLGLGGVRAALERLEKGNVRAAHKLVVPLDVPVPAATSSSASIPTAVSSGKRKRLDEEAVASSRSATPKRVKTPLFFTTASATLNDSDESLPFSAAAAAEKRLIRAMVYSDYEGEYDLFDEWPPVQITRVARAVV